MHLLIVYHTEHTRAYYTVQLYRKILNNNLEKHRVFVVSIHKLHISKCIIKYRKTAEKQTITYLTLHMIQTIIPTTCIIINKQRKCSTKKNLKFLITKWKKTLIFSRYTYTQTLFINVVEIHRKGV